MCKNVPGTCQVPVFPMIPRCRTAQNMAALRRNDPQAPQSFAVPGPDRPSREQSRELFRVPGFNWGFNWWFYALKPIKYLLNIFKSNLESWFIWFIPFPPSQHVKKPETFGHPLFGYRRIARVPNKRMIHGQALHLNKNRSSTVATGFLSTLENDANGQRCPHTFKRCHSRCFSRIKKK